MSEDFAEKKTIPSERGGYDPPVIARKSWASKATPGGVIQRTLASVGVRWNEFPSDIRFFRELVSLGMAIDPQIWRINKKSDKITPKGCS